ncbi:MAG: hypothetical protein H7Y36_09180 [Armatimonadetes bacterium]|nr:hypothetical protein [Akkermansiaceae bacterium]
MAPEINLDHRAGKKNRPWTITLIGLLTIAGMASMPLLAGEPDGDRMPDLVRFLGHFHPVVLHLPIGIFALILLQEITAVFTKQKRNDNLVPMAAGAVSAVIAVLAGFLMYHGGGFEGSEIAELHLWGGLAFASAAVLTYIVKTWTVALHASQFPFQILLLSTVGVMGYASHNGGSLTHGSDHLVKYAPDPIRGVLGLEPKEKPKDTMPLESQVVYADIIHPILESRCIKCHKEGNSKGKLRMDTFDLLVKGGKEGSALEAGNASDSNMIIRAELPDDDEEHMPPEGKPQIEDHELLIVKWWIDQGADPVKKVGELALNDEVRAAIAKLNMAADFNKDHSLGKADITQTKTSNGKQPQSGEKTDALTENLQKIVADLSAEFPGGLAFESQESANLTFTAVSLRNNLTDENFAKLGPVIPKMVSMDLSATSITDRSVALLAPAGNLRMIRLCETAIGDASLDTLLKLKNLESINLFGTKVSDAGVKKLVALPKLKRLYLWQTEVSEAVIAELKKQLPELQVITGI